MAIGKKFSSREEMLEERPNDYTVFPYGELEYIVMTIEDENFWESLAIKMHPDDLSDIISRLEGEVYQKDLEGMFDDEEEIERIKDNTEMVIQKFRDEIQ